VAAFLVHVCNKFPSNEAQEGHGLLHFLSRRRLAGRVALRFNQREQQQRVSHDTTISCCCRTEWSTSFFCIRGGEAGARQGAGGGLR